MDRPDKSHSASLSARDRAILDHVARYRLAIPQTVRQLYLRGRGKTAAVKVISRLCGAGYLARIRLLDRSTGLVLTPRAARLVGSSVKRSISPGPQSLPIDYAVLLYATAHERGRRRLTRTELSSHYPWIGPALAGRPHCLDESQPGQPVLELVRVDLGGKPDHVARKCARDLKIRSGNEAFPALLRTGRFRLVVLTTTRGKAELIRQALDRHTWPDGLVIHLAAIPQLSPYVSVTSHAS